VPKRASQAKRKREAEPEAPPPPAVREARPADAAAIAGLLDQLGYDVVAADVRKRLAALRRNDEPVLVAARGKALIGCLSWHVTPVIHRPRPVGRITMLVVAEAERGAGIGKLLVGAAEARLRQRGCGLLEVTSNIKRMRAHAFYTGLGFERTSYRFAKPLAD
jgi:ribosomal protein S18 acetylase RimI-like enzyme